MKAYLLRCKANIGTYMCMYTVKPLPFANPQFSNLPPTICLQFLSTSSILFLLTFFLLLRSASILYLRFCKLKLHAKMSPPLSRPNFVQKPRFLPIFSQWKTFETAMSRRRPAGGPTKFFGNCEGILNLDIFRIFRCTKENEKTSIY